MQQEQEDFDPREERASQLDRFAKAGGDDTSGREVMVPQQAFSSTGERVIGAQAVAVRRDEGRVLLKLRELAAAAGDDWLYRWPVKNRDGTTGYIEGPSIKLANDLARLYGNCDVDVFCVDMGPELHFKARFVDYESGFSLARLFKQRKSQKTFKTDPERQQDIIFQIGQSKAIRNAIVNALQTFADYAFEEAKASVVDKIGKRIEHYRARVSEKVTEAKIDIRRVERIVGRSLSEWVAADIGRVIAMVRAVSDGMATWDETFPPLDQPVQTVSDAEVVEDQPGAQRFAEGKSDADTEAKGRKKPAKAAKDAPAEARAGAEPPAGEATAKDAPAQAEPAAKPGEAQAAAKPEPAAEQEAAAAEPEPKPAAAEEPEPQPAAAKKELSADDKVTLKKYGDGLANQMTQTGLQKVGARIFGGDMPDEGTVFGDAVAAVFSAHVSRIKGESSPTDADNVVKALLK